MRSPPGEQLGSDCFIICEDGADDFVGAGYETSQIGEDSADRGFAGADAAGEADHGWAGGRGLMALFFFRVSHV